MKLEAYTEPKLATTAEQAHSRIERLKKMTGLNHVSIIQVALEFYEDSLKRETDAMNQGSIKTAYETLQNAMQADSSYAWSWHCNIVMPILDYGFGAGVGMLYRDVHAQANKAVANVMQHIFKVDVKASAEWKQTFKDTI